MLIVCPPVGHHLTIGNFEDCSQAIRNSFVGTEHPKIPILFIRFDYVAQKPGECPGGSLAFLASLRKTYGVLLEIWHFELFEQHSAVRVWIRSHASRALRRKLSEFGHQLSRTVEKLLWFVAFKPRLELCKMFFVRLQIGVYNLMRAERAFVLFSVDFLGACPPLGRYKNDHRPARPRGCVSFAGVLLYALYLDDCVV